VNLAVCGVGKTLTDTLRIQEADRFDTLTLVAAFRATEDSDSESDSNSESESGRPPTRSGGLVRTWARA